MSEQKATHYKCSYRKEIRKQYDLGNRMSYICSLTESNTECNQICKSDMITQDEKGLIHHQEMTNKLCKFCQNTLFEQIRKGISDYKTWYCPTCRYVFYQRDLSIPVFFDFAHKYNKLANDEFTTIRSVKYLDTHKWVTLNSVGFITLKKRPFSKVLITAFEDKRIVDIPLKELKEDAESDQDNIHIKTTMDFVNLLDEFAVEKCGFGNNKITTLKRVFHIKKAKKVESESRTD